LKVSFAKEPYKRDDILQENPIIFRSLLTVATPYTLQQSQEAPGGGLLFGMFLLQKADGGRKKEK